MTPVLSIAIVLYNSADTLPVCLQSVREAVTSGWAELIAVDNASPDDGVAILERELPSARLIRLAENRGFGGGANTALAEATGRFWLLLNPDVRVPPNGLETLARWMDAHPGLGAASPEIVGDDGAWESPGRALPSIWRALLELSRAHRALPRTLRGRVLRGPYWTGGDQLDTGWVPGTAMIVRPEAVRDVGPLREHFFMYGEDIEWCWRMRQAGWRIGVCADTRFVHQRSSSAHRSWGEEDKERRIAVGIDAACQEIWGPLHARLFAGLTALSLWLESRAPRRDAAHRERTNLIARAWWEVAVRGLDYGKRHQQLG
jgi:GT2 family glycosyltransferase